MANIWINGKFFDETRVKAKKAEIENTGENDQKELETLYWENLEASIEDIEFTENSISVSIDTKLGYFSFDIPLDSSDLEALLGITIKKMNKIKTLLETLK